MLTYLDRLKALKTRRPPGGQNSHNPEQAPDIGVAQADPRGVETGETAAAPLAVPGLAVREVLGFRADWIDGLPVRPVLVLDAPHAGGSVRIDFRPDGDRSAFDSLEWLAMVRAAESGRARPDDLAQWAAAKRARPRWRLTEDVATSGRVYDQLALGWPVERVLDRLGATLRLVALDGGAPCP